MQTHHLFLSKLFTIATLAASLAACGGGGGGGGDGGGGGGGDSEHSSESTHSSFATSSTTATNGASGQALYAAYCASCHGASFAPAQNYASTLSAIARNKGGMGYLSSTIQTTQANDIATYLTYGATGTASTQTPTSTPTSTPTLTAQTISFASPGNQTLSSTAVTLTASASSGLAVTLTSSTPTVCIANGALLSLLGVGTCTVTASQLGDATFAAATPVNTTFSVTVPVGPALSAQTIAFTSPGNLVLGITAPALAATATSGLPVSFASATPSVCSVSGSTLNLRLPGTCTVVANQPGDANYAAAASVANTFYAVAANAAAGKAAYNLVVSGQSCASCHGVPGSQPTSLILSAANADVVLSSAILNNVGGMGTLNGRYTQLQILDIAAYLATPGL